MGIADAHSDAEDRKINEMTSIIAQIVTRIVGSLNQSPAVIVPMACEIPIEVRMLGSVINAVAHRIGIHISRHRPERTDLPAFVGAEFIELYRRCRHATMTTWTGCYQTYLATCYIAHADIPGDIVECGVYRGGLPILIGETLKRRGIDNRSIWLYDTFAGMPPPSDLDFARHDGKTAAWWLRRSETVYCIAPREIVERNLDRADYPRNRFILVEGRVEETIPANVPDRIALLRLDTDWYDSTRHELDHLFPRLMPGGILICDDYGIWDGARKALDEYLVANGIRMALAQDTEYGAVMGVRLG